MASILTALKYQEPLDAVLYCEVMFDKKISGEVPEHRRFIEERAVPWLKRHGIPVLWIKSERTYLDVFYQVIWNSQNPLLNGKYTGFPLSGRCHIQSRCKCASINQYMKRHFAGKIVKYLGIRKDEPVRLARLGANQVSLLEKYGVGNEKAIEITKEAGLFSPVYEFARRSGCWFCPNASERELDHLKRCHPELWKKLLLLDMENSATKKFNRSYTLFELDNQLGQMF